MSTLTLKEAHEKIKEITLSSGFNTMIIMENGHECLVDMTVDSDEINRQVTMLSLLENAVKGVCAELINTGLSHKEASSLIKICVLFGIAKADKVAEYRHED